MSKAFRKHYTDITCTSLHEDYHAIYTISQQCFPKEIFHNWRTNHHSWQLGAVLTTYRTKCEEASLSLHKTVVLNVWVTTQTWVPNMGRDQTQTWVVMGPRMGREGILSKQCLVAQKPGKIQPSCGILILSMSYNNKVLFKYQAQAPCRMHWTKDVAVTDICLPWEFATFAGWLQIKIGWFLVVFFWVMLDFLTLGLWAFGWYLILDRA